VTVVTGPSFDSQRDEVDDFITNLAKIPQMFGLVADLLVKAKNMGPLGDQIADRLTPPQFKQPAPMPPEAQQALQGMQQKLMAINAHSQQVEKRLAQLVQEKQAKIIDNQFKQAMQTMDQQTQLAIAWIKAKVDVGTQLGEQEWKELELIHNSALEAAKLAAQHAHEFSMAQFEAENQPEPATPVQ
jgi:acetoin utilization deacetylase AcuC-like enzyme